MHALEAVVGVSIRGINGAGLVLLLKATLDADGGVLLVAAVLGALDQGRGLKHLGQVGDGNGLGGGVLREALEEVEADLLLLLVTDQPGTLVLVVLRDVDQNVSGVTDRQTLLLADVIGVSAKLDLGALQAELLLILVVVLVHPTAAVSGIGKGDKQDEEDKGEHGLPDLDYLLAVATLEHDVEPDIGEE